METPVTISKSGLVPLSLQPFKIPAPNAPSAPPPDKAKIEANLLRVSVICKQGIEHTYEKQVDIDTRLNIGDDICLDHLETDPLTGEATVTGMYYTVMTDEWLVEIKDFPLDGEQFEMIDEHMKLISFKEV